MKIYKYKLVMDQSQVIRLPSPQKFLSVQYQGNDLCVWYEVNGSPSSDDFDDIEFIIAGTGHAAPDKSQYLGTVQQRAFVWHIYARCNHGR